MDVTPSGISQDVIPELTPVMAVTLYVRLLFLTVAGMTMLPLGVSVTVAVFVELFSVYVIPSMVSAKAMPIPSILRNRTKKSFLIVNKLCAYSHPDSAINNEVLLNERRGCSTFLAYPIRNLVY